MGLGFYKTPEQYAESSGRINERFVFGAVRADDPNYKKEEQALIQKYRDIKKPVQLGPALEVVKHFQPFKPDSKEMVDPASPTKQFPYAIRKFIANELGLTGEKDKNVLFWTTVGSLVDTSFGADSIIEIRNTTKESLLLRVDVTKHDPGETKKESADNSDRVIIYGEIPDAHFDKRGFDAKVREVGKEAIEKLMAQKGMAAERAA